MNLTTKKIMDDVSLPLKDLAESDFIVDGSGVYDFNSPFPDRIALFAKIGDNSGSVCVIRNSSNEVLTCRAVDAPFKHSSETTEIKIHPATTAVIIGSFGYWNLIM